MYAYNAHFQDNVCCDPKTTMAATPFRETAFWAALKGTDGILKTV